MRSDMAKIVTERPRRGRGYDRGEVRRRPRLVGEELEGYVKHQGMRRAWGDNRKEFSDLLSPLYRYLDKQVGRPWDHVWSELAKTLDFRSVSGFHIRSHVDNRIHRHIRMINGVPHEPNAYNRIDHAGWWSPIEGLYVHPADGLLKRTKPKPRYRVSTDQPAWRKIIDEWTQLHWAHNGWFLVRLAPMPSDRTVFSDAMGDLRGETTSYNTGRGFSVRVAKYKWMTFSDRYGRSGVYAVSKRQISRKEKRSYGL